MSQALYAAVSLFVIVVILWDAFETVVLPRRVTRRVRLTSGFYRLTWTPVAAIARRLPPSKQRDRYLSFYGPLSLLLLLLVWAVGLIFAFALLQWAAGARLQSPGAQTGFGTYLYLSGVTFFTLGYGDVYALEPLGRVLSVVEAGTGFGFLAIIIGYLPVLYQSFSRREVSISMLDARAGSPPTAAELLRRHADTGNMGRLGVLLLDWERWAADLLESHLSYPVLCYYRSQHDNQSWLASLTCVLDTCALVQVGIDGAHAWQARLTFAMARHAVVDIAQIFNTRPVAPGDERLPAEELRRLRAMLTRAGLVLRDGPEAEERLKALRHLYEPYVNGLACHLLISLPPWLPSTGKADNWQTSAFERDARGVDAAAAPVLETFEDEHF
jgi:voltage-gated potassium channel Kch